MIVMKEKPILEKIMNTEEVFWENPHYKSFNEGIKKIHLTEKDVKEAGLRLKRFAPYLKKVFPETRKDNGMIESPLIKIPHMKKAIEKRYNISINHQLLLKCDHKLAISGSIKARGGIYEVLKHAEELAISHKLLEKNADYSILDSEKFKNFYSQYKIAVGSTGNLGLSIGIMSAKLGFKVYVHMSSDAKKWKKDLLRQKGVTVIEYDADYSEAVKEGRKQAKSDPFMYFIDDENSNDLFLGYAVSAYRLKEQLNDLGFKIDQQNPLYVYLPCGVGGGPGGVTFGLKLLFKDHVKCYFAEPTHSPCMLLGLLTGLHQKVCVQDFGLDNQTVADGLAVGRPSGFVGKTLNHLISGVYTISDDNLLILLKELANTENIKLEPSALASLYGVTKHQQRGVHLAWATGDGMVPDDIMSSYF